VVEVPVFTVSAESLDRLFRRTKRALLRSLSRSPARQRRNPDHAQAHASARPPMRIHHDRLSKPPVIDDARRRCAQPPPLRELLLRLC
jgi:hypothetical protein